MEAEFVLNDVLIQLGMVNAFIDGKADFTAIVSEQDDSSEAAAATAVTMRLRSMPMCQGPGPIVFRADRPFLFFIRESRQNIILFSAKFVSPPATS
ncbi:unnamed protein product [Rotaria sp. Silwood2]|nr:unnamed protein product [Rotaria sp. Silwood2]CAF4576394.1 unnamed protein product [Rotaria sp. Silwood2]